MDEQTSALRDHEVEEKFKWMKGHMRDENAASRCKYLRVSFYAAIGEMPVSESIEIPGVNNKQMTQRVIQGMPQMCLVCDSPGLIADQQQNLASVFAGDIASQIKKLNISMSICRLCPYWESEKFHLA